MRQQPRLRVLLPIAVLGLLGAGFGAYAFGQAPEPGSAPPVATTTAPEPAPAVGRAVEADAWAEQVDALCATLKAEVGPLELPKYPAPKDIETALVGLRRSLSTLREGFVAAGWPRGERRAVLAARAELAEGDRTLRRGLAALRRGDLERRSELVSEDSRFDAIVRRLGARKCTWRNGAESSWRKPQGTMPAPVALEWMLFAKRAVVVLFYTPNAGLDGTLVMEARAAALSVDAGFLPVNVARNREVSGLAGAHEVKEAPAVLVFTRGPKPVARFDRVADRETIAQAVQNALR